MRADRDNLSRGAPSKSHGVLHSGARYAEAHGAAVHPHASLESLIA